MTDVVLECSGLRKVYGDLVAVDDVGFTIEAGETYGLLGPNGAGKTTTISMIAGLLDNDGGTAVVSGNEITTKSTAAKAAIGLVPQDLAIYPDLTARENLRFFGKLYSIDGNLNERVDEILDIIELADRADDQIKEYSGGMKRRLNIGLGLLHKPDLLILDEPTVGVDPQSRNAILENVERLGAEGMAVLYTTHYMEEAERLCDRVGIIDEGTIIAEGARRELVALVGERDRLHLELSGDASGVTDAVSAIPDIDSCSAAGPSLEVVAVSASRALPDVVLSVSDAGLDVHSVQVSEPDLESVFLHLTGKALRE
ncbi:MAG: ABC transporter ATP-binding protein [Actinomycetota bacterium]|nr:ABC transporter ATP-binding protein [Actinomycetota bacterium]